MKFCVLPAISGLRQIQLVVESDSSVFATENKCHRPSVVGGYFDPHTHGVCQVKSRTRFLLAVFENQSPTAEDDNANNQNYRGIWVVIFG